MAISEHSICETCRFRGPLSLKINKTTVECTFVRAFVLKVLSGETCPDWQPKEPL